MSKTSAGQPDDSRPKRKRATKKATAKKNTGGRPTRYRVEFAEQATKLCRLGATDKELADFLVLLIRQSLNGRLIIEGFRRP